MNFARIVLAGAIVAVAGVAFAKGERTEPEAKARAETMQTIAAQTKVLGDMAGGKVAFDAAAAEAAKAALVAAAGNIPTAFETQGAADPASEAKPDVWSNWDEFLADAAALKTAAEAVDVSSVDGIKAGMGGIGGACKDCHTDFRM